jgi:hypothetical protein
MTPIFLDFETYYDKDYSLSKISTQEYIKDPRFKVHGMGVASEKSKPVWVTGAKCKDWVERIVPQNIVVCHNAHFDAAILAFHYGVHPKFIIDTVSLSRALVGEALKSHSLANVGEKLLGEEKGAYLAQTLGVQTLTPEQEQQLAAYCLKDVELCRGIYAKLIKHFPRKELLLADRVCRFYTEPSLLLDGGLLKTYKSDVVKKKQEALYVAGVEDETTLRSNPQFADALKALGIEPPMKLSPTTGKPAFAFAKTDEGLLALQDHPDERVQALVAARLECKSTLAETRAERFITASRYGAFPVQYLFSGAQTTHRLSGGGGDNLQNLPRPVEGQPASGALRRSILAPHHHTLLAADLAQIELRVTLGLAVELARLSGQKNTAEEDALKILGAGGDLYSHFGSLIYGREITKKNAPKERQMAKSAVLGLGFGMGVDRFMEYCKTQGVEVDRETAERTVKLYRGTYSGVTRLWRYVEDGFKRWMNECDAIGFRLQMFKQPDIWITDEPIFSHISIGRPGCLQVKYPNLKFNGEDNQFTYSRATGETRLFGGKFVENLVQYLAREIIMEQLLLVQKAYKVVMTTHDEIVAVVPQGEEEIAKSYIGQVMTRPLDWWPSLPLGVEMKTADRYGDCK